MSTTRFPALCTSGAPWTPRVEKTSTRKKHLMTWTNPHPGQAAGPAAVPSCHFFSFWGSRVPTQICFPVFSPHVASTFKNVQIWICVWSVQASTVKSCAVMFITCLQDLFFFPPSHWQKWASIHTWHFVHSHAVWAWNENFLLNSVTEDLNGLFLPNTFCLYRNNRYVVYTSKVRNIFHWPNMSETKRIKM